LAGIQNDSDAAERSSLLAAAWEVLEVTGYENLKVHVVLRRAGLSTRAFYRHFKGKDELLMALATEERARAEAILVELTSHGEPEERVRAWVDAVVSLLYGRHAGPRARLISSMPAILHTELASGSALRSAGGPSTTTPLRAAIAAGKASGVFPNADPDGDADLIAALCSRLTEAGHSWMPADRRQGVAFVAEFVLRALRG
jgi:AcrR family transcriptional regulator